ncbi:MAG: SigB/SigF/SigG family RNA polymerase sigma factor [Thermoleophilaceae bacterium]
MQSKTEPHPGVEERLLRRYREGDLAARDELVEALRPFAQRLASRYRHTTESQEDLEQVAYIGLLKAIDRHDPDVGPFMRYAVPTILGELKRHFRDRGWGIHVSRALQERFLVVGNAVDELTVKIGRSPTPAELAEHTGLSVEEVLEALSAATAYAPTSLDGPRSHSDGGEQDGALVDTLGAEDERYELVELGASLAPALRALPERERLILHLRFAEDMTQSEIAERVGISQMHVSRLLRRSIERLSAAAR